MSKCIQLFKTYCPQLDLSFMTFPISAGLMNPDLILVAEMCWPCRVNWNINCSPIFQNNCVSYQCFILADQLEIGGKMASEPTVFVCGEFEYKFCLQNRFGAIHIVQLLSGIDALHSSKNWSSKICDKWKKKLGTQLLYITIFDPF